MAGSKQPAACTMTHMDRLPSRRDVFAGGGIVAAAAAGLIWRPWAGSHEPVDDDPVIDPRWGLTAGQHLGFTRADGSVVRFGISHVYRPDKEYDYLRVTALAVDTEGRAAAVDLASKDGQDDSYVPVGDPAKAMSLGQGISQAGQLVEAAQSVITPGYVLMVPGERATDSELSDAGFRLLDQTTPVPAMNGYARMLTWNDLRQRLA